MSKLNEMTACRSRCLRLGFACALAGIALVATLPASAGGHASSREHKQAKPTQLTVTTGSLTFTYAAPLWLLLASKVSAVAPAKLNSAGTITFPLTGGSLSKAGLQGTLRARGGMTSKLHEEYGEGVMVGEATNPIVSLGRTSTLIVRESSLSETAPVAYGRVLFFSLVLTDIKPSVNGHHVVISKIPAKLTLGGADFFGDADPFTIATEIGTVTLSLND